MRRAADNLLNYQIPGGGYMHPHGRKVNVPTARFGWTPCVTGYVTKVLMDLGLGNDSRVRVALEVMRTGQRENGGWICNHVGQRAPYCIWSGTPWVFACLAHAGLITKNSRIAHRALGVFGRHKEKIIRHGYHRDHYYRCDEALLLPAFCAIGLSARHPLVKDLRESLIAKQQPNGCWLFGGRHPHHQPRSIQRMQQQNGSRLLRGTPSAWYTIEAVAALQTPDRV